MKIILICGLLLCLILAACNISTEIVSDLETQANQSMLPTSDLAPTVEPIQASVSTTGEDIFISPDNTSTSEPSYIKTYIQAYTDFLLKSDIDADNDSGLPIRGYYLFDLDFDDIPELGVFHDSFGSMGGYFTYFRFDGESVVPIMNGYNSPAQFSNYTEALADDANKKVYFLKEMYLLRGNENGTYGYLRELAIQDGVPSVYDILSLIVDEKSVLDIHIGNAYFSEDEFLSDIELDVCLITKHYADGEWEDISSAEYLELKREIIPMDNSFTNLLDTDICYIGAEADMLDDIDWSYKSIRLTLAEINTLFSKWQNKQV